MYTGTGTYQVNVFKVTSDISLRTIKRKNPHWCPLELEPARSDGSAKIPRLRNPERGGDSARRKCALFLGIKTGTYRARVVWMWLSPSHRCPWCSWGWCTRAAQTGGGGGQQWRGTPGPSALHTRPTLFLHSSSFLLCPNNSIQVFAAKKIADPDPIELLNCMQKFFNFDF